MSVKIGILQSSLTAKSTLRKSAHGCDFNIEDDTWHLRFHGNREVIRISSVRPYVEADLFNSLKSVFSVLAETRNAGSAAVMFGTFRTFLRFASANGKCPIQEVDAQHIAGWASNRITGTMLSYMRTTLFVWHKLRAPCLTADALELMERIINPPEPTQLPSVKSWDPSEGPYRPVDDEAIKIALNAAFNARRIPMFHYALMRMFRAIGTRPDQVASMKVEDIRQEGDRWYLRIPQAKQRGSDWRLSFMPWKPISQGFANVLILYIESEIRPRVSAHSKIEVCPLFPDPQTSILDGELTCHAKPRSITVYYQEAMERIRAISPISGELILGTPKRDRHTFLTHLAMNGCTAEEIAANAGHTKVASCTPYVDASIDHFQRMENLLGAAFVPIADRFVGNVVSREKDAHAEDAIIDEAATGVGSCSDGGCNAIETGAAPLACYSCRKFRAWADAPHADLLDMLIAQQERLRSLGHDAIAETTTSTIIAISDLLERIRLERAHD